MSKTFWSVKVNGIGWLKPEVYWFDSKEDALVCYRNAQAADKPIAHVCKKRETIDKNNDLCALTSIDIVGR